MKNLLKFVNDPQKRKDLPKLQVGDFVQVYIKIKEGNRERVQMFDGTIIAMKNGKRISATITVRKIASGVGVEKVFMLHSPAIDRIKVVRHGKVRRAKLYYLRDRVGKAAKVTERIVAKSVESEQLTVDSITPEAPVVAEEPADEAPVGARLGEPVEEVVAEETPIAAEEPADEAPVGDDALIAPAEEATDETLTTPEEPPTEEPTTE